jgi:hypothetical protein
MSRRRFLGGTVAGAAAVAAPYVKTSHSAGRLSVGLWDHWVPGANEAMEKICLDWGAANNVEITLDFITSIGNKLLLTAQAESRAETGHDVYSVPLWMPSIFRDSLEPVDDLVAEIVSRHGPLVGVADYMAKFDGSWRAVPAPTGSLTLAMVSRLDFYREHAGIDLQTIFPAGERDPALVATWTYDRFLDAAGKLHGAGFSFGAPIAPGADSQGWLGQVFNAFGAVLVDAGGEIAVDSDETRAVLDYLARLTGFMPEAIYAWDDASNNRWLISGQGSTIINPPSAWAVARRDAPEVAAQVWHHDVPKGPAGRFRTSVPFFWGMWKFGQNKGAARALLVDLNERAVVETMLRASQGFDVPLTVSFRDSDVWETATPPAGVLHNYPVRGDEQVIVAGYPAPPAIASQIFTQAIMADLVARVTADGEAFDDAIGWAGDELAGFMRG